MYVCVHPPKKKKHLKHFVYFMGWISYSRGLGVSVRCLSLEHVPWQMNHDRSPSSRDHDLQVQIDHSKYIVVNDWLKTGIKQETAKETTDYVTQFLASSNHYKSFILSSELFWSIYLGAIDYTGKLWKPPYLSRFYS